MHVCIWTWREFWKRKVSSISGSASCFSRKADLKFSILFQKKKLTKVEVMKNNSVLLKAKIEFLINSFMFLNEIICHMWCVCVVTLWNKQNSIKCTISKYCRRWQNNSFQSRDILFFPFCWAFIKKSFVITDSNDRH